MFKTKRKRVVALALIAFFCAGAVTYVAVDWERFGGGFLAFLRGKGEPHLASAGAGRSSALDGHLADIGPSHSDSPSLPRMAAAASHRRHTAGAGSGANGRKSDDDLFTFGNPAAGGIPPGNFIVAQNDAPAGGNNGGGAGPAPSPSAAPESSGTPPAGGGEGGAGSPAPPPTTGNGGGGDIGLPIAQAPAPTPTPSPSPAAPAPAPTQSGTTDSDPPGGGTPTPPVPPVSAVPEASSLAMMSLGALFLAVAAQRRRKNG